MTQESFFSKAKNFFTEKPILGLIAVGVTGAAVGVSLGLVAAIGVPLGFGTAIGGAMAYRKAASVEASMPSRLLATFVGGFVGGMISPMFVEIGSGLGMLAAGPVGVGVGVVAGVGAGVGLGASAFMSSKVADNVANKTRPSTYISPNPKFGIVAIGAVGFLYGGPIGAAVAVGAAVVIKKVNAKANAVGARGTAFVKRKLSKKVAPPDAKSHVKGYDAPFRPAHNFRKKEILSKKKNRDGRLV